MEFLANERENICVPCRILQSSTCKHVTTDRQRDRQRNNENGFAWASGVAGGSSTCDAGEGCPPGPPLCGDVTGPFPLSLFSSRKVFWRMSGIFFGGRTVKVWLLPGPTPKSSTCMHVTTDRQERDRRQRNNKGCRALGVNSRRIRAAWL